MAALSLTLLMIAGSRSPVCHDVPAQSEIPFMVSLPEPTDPTLDAVDAALVARRETRFSRRLGASSIGRECERSLWLEFRWAKAPEFEAISIKQFEDGDRGEVIMAERLRMLNPEPVDRAAVHDNSHGTY